MEEDTSGFYKNDSGMLLHGKYYIMGGSYDLLREKKDEYEYPIHGWHWFDTEEDARNYFNLPKMKTEDFYKTKFE